MNPFTSLRRTAGLPLLALALLAGSCKTIADVITPGLPAPTQEGKDTFGCMLDGTLWLPNTKHTLDDILEASVTSQHDGFSLKAEDNRTPTNFWLYASDAAGLKPGTYALHHGFEAAYDGYKNSQYETYNTAPTDQGTLTITKFEPFTKTSTLGGQTVTVRGAIVSGTFAFTATSSTGHTITVREGRFDVNAYQ